MIALDYQKVLREDPVRIRDEVKIWFDNNYTEYQIIADLTGGTKPTTIALLDMGRKYHWKMVYFSSKKLIWI